MNWLSWMSKAGIKGNILLIASVPVAVQQFINVKETTHKTQHKWSIKTLVHVKIWWHTNAQ